jgi:hypothetical protein
MAAQWYFRYGDSEFGPVTAADLRKLVRTRRVYPDTPIRKGADGRWFAASEVKGLFTEEGGVPEDDSPSLAYADSVRAKEFILLFCVIGGASFGGFLAWAPFGTLPWIALGVVVGAVAGLLIGLVVARFFGSSVRSTARAMTSSVHQLETSRNWGEAITGAVRQSSDFQFLYSVLFAILFGLFGGSTGVFLGLCLGLFFGKVGAVLGAILLSLPGMAIGAVLGAVLGKYKAQAEVATGVVKIALLRRAFRGRPVLGATFLSLYMAIGGAVIAGGTAYGCGLTSPLQLLVVSLIGAAFLGALGACLGWKTGKHTGEG